MPVRQVVVTLVAAATCVVASCSSSDRSAGRDGAAPVGEPAAATEPCDLLTVADIDRATGWRLPGGERPDEAVQDGLDGTAVCNWEDRSLEGGVIDGAVQVQVVEQDGGAAYDRHRTELAASDPAVADVDVAGAAQAFQSAGSGTVGMLVGDRFVQVSTIGGSLDGSEHLELAAEAAERIPS